MNRPPAPVTDEALRKVVEDLLGPTPSLLIPARPEPRERLPQGLSDMMKTYVTYEDVVGRPASLAELTALVPKVKLRNALMLLSAVSVLLDIDSKLSIASQASLAQSLLEEDILRALSAHIQDRGGDLSQVLFHEHQIVMAAKYFLLHGRNYARKWDPHIVGRILLMARELVDAEYSKLLVKDTVNESVEQLLTGYVIRQLLFQGGEPLRQLVSRYYRLLVELPEDAQMRASTEYVDIRRSFSDLVGVAPDEFLRLGLIIMMGSLLRATDVTTPIKPVDVVVEPRILAQKLILPAQKLRGFLTSNSRSSSEFAAAFAKQNMDNAEFYYNFVAMQDKPLVRVSAELIVPISHSLLKEKVTSGMYWILHRFFSDSGTKPFFLFTSFFGQLFEAYIRETFARMFSRNWGRLYYERDVKPDGSDIVIPYGPTWYYSR